MEERNRTFIFTVNEKEYSYHRETMQEAVDAFREEFAGNEELQTDFRREPAKEILVTECWDL